MDFAPKNRCQTSSTSNPGPQNKQLIVQAGEAQATSYTGSLGTGNQIISLLLQAGSYRKTCRITECCIRSLGLEHFFDSCLIDFVKIVDLCFIVSYHCISVILLFNYMRSWRGGGDAALLRLGYSLQMT